MKKWDLEMEAAVNSACSQMETLQSYAKLVLAEASKNRSIYEKMPLSELQGCAGTMCKELVNMDILCGLLFQLVNEMNREMGDVQACYYAKGNILSSNATQ